MNDIERHNEMSEEFDKMTAELKEMSSDNPRYEKLWNDRAELKNEMDTLSKSITG